MSEKHKVKSEKAGYEGLIVWQKAHELVRATYKITEKFPREEIFGLVSQMRRCAVSVPANIVEGYQRKSVREKLNFYNIAHGSLAELGYYFRLSCDLGYLAEDSYEDILKLRNEVGRLLHGFIASY